MKIKKLFKCGLLLVMLFVVWTLLVMSVDVKAVGVEGTNIGFSTLNVMFHKITGINMSLYYLGDLLSFIPLCVCLFFGILGIYQLINRKSLFKVDLDIIILGLYYVVVIVLFLLFEKIIINYRPILINGIKEASYPSSTTLLILTVMPTLIEQVNRRIHANKFVFSFKIIINLYTVFMVFSRLICGVHWVTDIIGGILLSSGLFLIYKSMILMYDRK